MYLLMVKPDGIRRFRLGDGIGPSADSPRPVVEVYSTNTEDDKVVWRFSVSQL